MTAFNPSARGFHAIYHIGETNHCPGCGRSHWAIGRTTAECCFCSTALPLEASARSQSPVRFFGKGGGKISRMMVAA